MYEVYSAQRPGRPGKTVAATAILLLITAGLAEALIYYRARGVSVQLGPSKQFIEGELSVRLPDGWSSLAADEWPIGAVTGLESPDSGGRTRRIFVFRGSPLPDTMPLLGGLDAILRASKPLGCEIWVKEETGPAQMGGLPGVKTLTMPRQLLTAGELPFCLGQAAVGPGGEVVGVLLQSETLPSRVDRALLEEIAGSLRLLSLELDVDPGQAMSAAGISFDRPDGARFIGPVDAAVPRLRMMGGQDRTAWYLDLYRVPLVGERVPMGLVEDRALSHLRTVRLPQPPEPFDAAARKGARISLGDDGREPSVHIVAVRTDPQTALLMTGRFEAEAAAQLRTLCQSIAETAKVSPFESIVSIEAGLQAGRRQINETRQRGMTALFKRMEGKTRRFAIKSPMMDLGTWTDTYRREQEDDQASWEIATRLRYNPAWLGQNELVVTESWKMAEDGVGYRYEFQRLENRRATLHQMEDRRGDRSPVKRVVETLRGSRRDTLAVDDSYVGGVLLMQVAAAISRDVPPRPLILSGIGTFTTGAVYFVLNPVGKLPLPGSGVGDKAWAVRMMSDYDPAPALMFFDDEGGLLAMSFDGQQWRERTEESLPEEEAPGADRRRER